MQLQQLIGVWKLLFINITDPTADHYDYGSDPLGRIIVTQDGYLNAMIIDPRIPLPKGTSWSNATKAQLGTFAKPAVIYEGTVTLRNESGGWYTHTAIDNALNPEWFGTDQVRHAFLEEKAGKSRLTLIPLDTNGKEGAQQLVWEKMNFSASSKH